LLTRSYKTIKKKIAIGKRQETGRRMRSQILHNKNAVGEAMHVMTRLGIIKEDRAKEDRIGVASSILVAHVSPHTPYYPFSPQLYPLLFDSSFYPSNLKSSQSVLLLLRIYPRIREFSLLLAGSSCSGSAVL
jgi:hypothetical protein